MTGVERRYPQLPLTLPAHLQARLLAAATALRKPVADIVAAGLEAQLAELTDEQRELIDRIATSLLHSHELGSSTG